MPRNRNDDERRAAVETLFRVRAVETPADTSGEREVWHQGSKGADLMSIVNRTGHVVRQEFVLFDEYFLWTKQDGLRTGVTEEMRGIKDVIKASDDIRMDGGAESNRVHHARVALNSYSGDDKYLLHMRAAINMAAQGDVEGEFSAVTSAQRIPEDIQLAAAALRAKNAGKAVAPAQVIWPFLLAGIGVGVLVVVAVWLMIG